MTLFKVQNCQIRNIVNYQLRKLRKCHEKKYIYIDLIGIYVIRKNGQKEKLNLEAVTMIFPVTGWSEITKYEDKRAISIANLVETLWLTRYHRPMEITYDQGQ